MRLIVPVWVKEYTTHACACSITHAVNIVCRSYELGYRGLGEGRGRLCPTLRKGERDTNERLLILTAWEENGQLDGIVGADPYTVVLEV